MTSSGGLLVSSLVKRSTSGQMTAIMMRRSPRRRRDADSGPGATPEMDSVGSPDRTATCISWDLATGADSSPAASLAQQSFLPELPTRSTRSMPLGRIPRARFACPQKPTGLCDPPTRIDVTEARLTCSNLMRVCAPTHTAAPPRPTRRAPHLTMQRRRQKSCGSSQMTRTP